MGDHRATEEKIRVIVWGSRYSLSVSGLGFYFDTLHSASRHPVWELWFICHNLNLFVTKADFPQFLRPARLCVRRKELKRRFST